MNLSPRNRRLLLAAASIVGMYALLGFFAAPWALKKTAVETVAETAGAELRLSKVSINPFVLSLLIEGLELDDPQGESFASVEEIFVNFQLSSLFRWAWTFDELRISGPSVNVSRSRTGALNVSRFRGSSPGDAAPPTEPDGEGMPRLRIFNFALSGATVRWRDQVPVDFVDTTLGPVDIQISDLNTLPQKPGNQTVVIQSEATGTLRWDGTLQFNPFQSAGHASVEGSHFPLLSAYIKYQTGFDVVQGDADLQLDYQVMSQADGQVSAEIENLGVTFNNLLLNTFSVSGDTDTDRQVLSLPLMQIAGGRLAWPQKSIRISSLQIDNPTIGVHRDETGSLNVIRTLPEPPGGGASPPAEDSQTGGAGSGDWSLLLGQFVINNLQFDVDDESVEPAAAVGLEAFNLDIRDIDNQQGTRFPTTLEFQVQSGGRATLEGGVTVLPEMLFDFGLAIDDLALAGAHPYLATRADVQIDSGALAVAGKLTRTAEEPFALNADVSITEFLITETDEGSRLGSWDAVVADNVVFSTAARSLEISEIRMQRAYGDIRIAADGSVNLGRISRGEERVEDQSPTNEPVPDESPNSFVVTVGRVVIEDAAADFADLSLPLPFSAEIAEMNGELSTIATDSSEPSSVSLEGKVDEFGLFRVTGVVTPLAPAQNTDIKLAFQNVDMPKFSAYSIPFAGREIDSGRLDLDLGYQVSEGMLVGENKVVLRDFELGETVPHPGAMSLPLGLAVALLKDGEGKINIDLPVRGSVNDPEFSYGGVILSALGNVLVKIVTSPFALLGKLVGVEADELESIAFQPGRADLTPPELEKANKLAEALALRPELFLEFSGVANRQIDGLALRTTKLDQLVESRIEAAAPNAADAVMFNDQQREVLQQLYQEQISAADSEAALQELRQQFVIVAEGEDNAEAESLDELAYVAELRRRLIDTQPLTDAEFTALADKRAANAQSAVLGADQTLQNRVRLVASSAVEGDLDAPVEMPVTLTVDAE
jgi:hypothetical protein